MDGSDAGPEHVTLTDPELPAVHEQLIVFARELGELYRLERARSAELERVLASLQETYIATMKSLAQVIEAKDVTTRGHLDRTQAYGLSLAGRVDADLVTEELGYGFFLHDIGKVGIPEHILCKRGPLSAEEWRVMRTHPLIGAQIVAPIAFLRGAVELVRHHHERFDGSGYPDGLHGERIPLAARVFAVADSFDAMTSDRPYRSAMGVERALAEIQGGAGTQFDPEVVRVFVQMIREDPPELEVEAQSDDAFSARAG
ncbi:MAG TPA: HD domain-containing phosphohydrolase [Actinomycetota bacterium]|nr:HD domain-containing phosphohydrolase [Actinomycetota bacterium]